jgi:hypothetical protein
VIGAVKNAGNGVYTATITSSKLVGTATITATDGSVSGQAALVQTVGPAASVAVTLKPASVVADGVSTTTATATVTDAQRRGLSAEPVAFGSSDSGEVIGAVKNAGNGVYTATITVSTTLGTATITATDGSVSGHASLVQTVGPAASVAVTLKPASVVADGVSSTTATATVTDAEGRGLSAEPVAFGSSDAGEVISAVKNAGNGTYTATITASTTVGTATITATDGSVSGHAALAQTAGPPVSVAVTVKPASIVADGVSSTTVTATVTDAEGHGLPAEPVAFASSDPNETIGALKNAGNGSYTATVTASTTVGTATITATDGSLSGHVGLVQTAGPPASVAVALKPASVVADGVSTTTATATVTDAERHGLPGEPVTFASSDPNETVGAVKNAGNGNYTATITSSTTVGTATITASDGSLSGQAALAQTVGPAASVSMTLQPASIVADGVSTTTATATVTDAEGHLLRGDTIVFSSSDPGQFFGPVSTNPNGTYSAQIRGSKSVGRATITATDTSHLSAQATLTQAAGPSTMALMATPSSLVTNQSVTLVAVVTPSTGSPSGTITFDSSGAPIAGCAGLQITAKAPTASCQTSFAATTSPEQLSAVFTPDATSTAPEAVGNATVIVNQDSPSVSLVVAGSVQLGQSTTYSATVAPPDGRPGPTLPSGSVAFFDNGQPVGSCRSQPLVSGIASCALDYAALGQHTVTAQYSGDANFTGSSSPAQTIRVVPVPAPVAPAVLGIVSSTMQWSFYFTPRYSVVRVLSINDVSATDSVLVTCRGRGCPFAAHIASTTTPKRCGRRGRHKCSNSGTVDLAPAFANHRLSVGATITVLISRPGWIGKYYGFAIRPRGGPKIRIDCLAPGSRRPGVVCSM